MFFFAIILYGNVFTNQLFVFHSFQKHKKNRTYETVNKIKKDNA